jgi:hypothetical protein
MDVVRILWTVNFFFFLLVLIFLWSKMYLVTKKINEVTALLKACEQTSPDPVQTKETPSAKSA